MIKLVLCDMDGTLVPFGADGVSQRSIRAIHGLAKAGVRFGPSSGREHADLVRFFHGDSSCVRTGILGGGKLVYVDDELVYKRPLPKDALRKMVEVLLDMPAAALTFYLPLDETGHGSASFGAAGATAEEAETIAKHLGHTFGSGLHAELPAGDITTGAILVDESQVSMAQVQAELSEACPELDVVVSGPSVMDVYEKGWSKARALPILQEYVGVERDEIAYFGDSHNDLAIMLELPNAFCMGGGQEEVKRAARWVIDTSENDGVAQVLESLARRGGELVEADWA